MMKMSEEREEVDSANEQPQHELKNCQQNTTKCATSLLSPTSASLDFECLIKSATDTSFEITIHQDNMEHIRTASIRLLEECLPGKNQPREGFKDSSLYRYKPFQIKGESDLESLLIYNPLLNRESSKQLRQMMQKEEGLIGLLKQAPEAFGLTVAKELVYVIFHILKKKYQEFLKFVKSKEPIIPKMPCFQDCCDDCLHLMGTSCPVYEELSLEEVGEFAERDIEIISNEIYFSDIRILNLKDINSEMKQGVNAVNKFVKFIKQVSRSVFLSIIGASEPFLGVLGLDFSREISLVEFSEVNLSIQKSLSRPFVPYEEDQVYDFVSKKIKF